MSQDEYQLDDFLSDIYFKKWVLTPDKESDQFWKNFLQKYPNKKATIANARLILTHLEDELALHQPQESQVDAMWKNIEAHALPQPTLLQGLWDRVPRWATSSAAALILILLGWILLPKLQKDQFSYESQTASRQHALIEKVNEGQGDLLVVLPDSSRITLKPNSRVSFPIAFQDSDIREVYLTGEAFFQVSENPQRPFYVYSHELVTKVLGTSFIVKAFDEADDMEVIVKTGKVSVFSRKSLNKSIIETSPNTRVEMITPNQMVKYERGQEAMHKSLINNPELLPSSKSVAMINSFRDVPVSNIFENIKSAYGIEIRYDQLLHGDCLLTASFGKETLFEKIDLICKGIEATYRIEDAQVIIEGRGCH